MKDKKLTVGQTVWVLDCPRYGDRTHTIKPTTITSAGNKYFTTEETGNTKYRVSDLTMVTNYTQSTAFIYLNKQYWLDHVERNMLNTKISKTFNYGASNHTLEQLRKVAEILNI